MWILGPKSFTPDSMVSFYIWTCTSAQLLSGVLLFAILWTTIHQAYLSFTVSPKACSNSRPFNQWCYLTISFSDAPFFFCPHRSQNIRVFSNELALHIRWSKYSSYSFSINPSNKYSESISFRIDWFDLLAVQGTLKSLFQHHSLIRYHSVFFTVHLSHPHMTTGKTIALTRWTFVGKGMSLLFKILSKFVIALLPRSKGLLISF